MRAHSYTSLQFSGMEGLGQVVIGSGGETFNHFLFVGVGSKENEVGVKLLVVAADALAQFDAADVGHAPVGDDKCRLVFDKQIHGLPATLRCQNGVVLFRKRLLDQFAIYRGIICY